jgi:hypothetical protein
MTAKNSATGEQSFVKLSQSTHACPCRYCCTEVAYCSYVSGFQSRFLFLMRSSPDVVLCDRPECEALAWERHHQLLCISARSGPAHAAAVRHLFCDTMPAIHRTPARYSTSDWYNQLTRGWYF